MRHASVEFHTLNLWLWQFLLLANSSVFLPLQCSTRAPPALCCSRWNAPSQSALRCAGSCFWPRWSWLYIFISLLFYLIIQKVKSQMLLSSTDSFPSCGAIIEPNEACSPTYGRAISNVSIDYVSTDAKLMPSPTNAERNRMYTVISQNGLLNFCILQFLRLEGTIWKTHTFYLDSAIVLMVSLPGPAKESWVGKMYLPIPLFPYDAAKERRKKIKAFIDFLFAFHNWNGMECAAMCLSQQRRSFHSEIFLFH